jgi:acetyl-CoA carboxylase carboxyl transferase alpha subunit
MSGALARELLGGKTREALEMAGRLREIFPGRFYVEVQDHGIPHQRSLIPQLVDLARRLETGIVATNDVHYLRKEEAASQEILVLIREQKSVQDPNRFTSGTDQRYLKSGEEMAAVFASLPDALAAPLDIAESIELRLSFDRLLLPDFPLPAGFESPDAYLRHLAREGLAARYGEVNAGLEARLEFELSIIAQMGYPGYFLIVRDFIHHARGTGIAVGPGRGSAAGSLVAYALGITDIDPLRFGLLFERFLNPERVSMPDIDVDFDYRRRGEVIDYVKAKYGEDSVTQIITFGTMAARGVIRDVGRALGVEYGEVDRIAKLVPAELGITLEKALASEPELAELAASDGAHGKLLEVARHLEGLARHASTHAAGVLIAPGRLDNVVPLFRSAKGEVSTQWDMKSVEKVGLLKMDFLGLRTLTVIEDALDLIEGRTGTPPDIREIPLDDPAAFEILRSAQTVAVFQLESSGMRDLLRRLAPETFEDVIAVNALYRPGPMGAGMVNDFIDCKHGLKPIRFEHEILEPILRPTYGMMVYQEQVMQIASAMAGFSLGDADLLRRAMGKKKKEEMDAQEERFVAGAVARDIPESTARRVFEQMAYFAGYGFNKSHSAAYALLSYQTAWLKAHHPAEFMAATLGCEMDSTDRVMVLVEECRRLRIPVLPPDLNSSGDAFSVTDRGIRFGLGAVKNVGHGTIDAVVREREENGPFRSLWEFSRRVGHEALNRRVVESLIAAGAFDSLEPSRARLFAAAPLALEAGARWQEEQARGGSRLLSLRAPPRRLPRRDRRGGHRGLGQAPRPPHRLRGQAPRRGGGTATEDRQEGEVDGVPERGGLRGDAGDRSVRRRVREGKSVSRGRPGHSRPGAARPPGAGRGSQDRGHRGLRFRSQPRGPRPHPLSQGPPGRAGGGQAGADRRLPVPVPRPGRRRIIPGSPHRETGPHEGGPFPGRGPSRSSLRVARDAGHGIGAPRGGGERKVQPVSSLWLDFEKPVVELETKIQELREFAATSNLEVGEEVARLEKKADRMRREIYTKLTRWQRVQLARHPRRPYTLDYLQFLAGEWTELHGDRSFRDDPSIVGGLARIDGRPLIVVGHQKGRNTKENIHRNFGMPHPEGYRKALRLFQLADRFRLPILTFIDTPGAYPGVGAEERGQSEAIARNLREMARLGVPVVSVVIGEGGSGGALALAVADRVYMLENAIYSVISPEGCAGILWKDKAKAPQAAEVMKLTARDVLELGVIDGLVEEPLGGAHRDPPLAAEAVKRTVVRALDELRGEPEGVLRQRRLEKYLAMGVYEDAGEVPVR